MFTTIVSTGFFLTPVLIVALSVFFCRPSYSMRHNTCLSLGIIMLGSVCTGLFFAFLLDRGTTNGIIGAIICMLILCMLLYSVPLACLVPTYHPMSMLLKEYLNRENSHRYQTFLQQQESRQQESRLQTESAEDRKTDCCRGCRLEKDCCFLATIAQWAATTAAAANDTGSTSQTSPQADSQETAEGK